MIQIVNRRWGGKNLVGHTTYVGRPSKLGNPFEIGRDGDREEVIEKYRNWIAEKCRTSSIHRNEILRLARIYSETGQLNLSCWCAPARCHAEIIRSLIIQYLDTGLL